MSSYRWLSFLLKLQLWPKLGHHMCSLVPFCAGPPDALDNEWRCTMASIYKRDNKYYIKFYESGSRIRRSLGTSNRNKALRLKEQIERELAAGQYRIER